MTADGRAEGVTPGPETETLGRSGFAHASEAEMSRILDFYGVTWRYEPTTFPILWNLDGEVVESFSPDFYLPEFDLYLEMTTLKQSLVRKKNRKLRRLRELYPDIRIKLFYARDFRAMMLKYGRLGLAQSLSGTSGQLVGGELASEAMREPTAAAVDADGSGVTPAPIDEPASVDATNLDGPNLDGANLDGPNPTAPKRRRRARRHGRVGARTDLTISRHVADA